MSKTNDGGPAFPRPASNKSGHPAQGGMTLRDWFAGQALAGLLANPPPNVSIQQCAKDAWRVADAMLEEGGRSDA